MADEKKFFPAIPEASWFTLREKFKQKVPSEVKPSYLASALSMTEASARVNVLTALKSLGLVEKDGKPSDLAYDWRDDGKYKEVCGKIIKSYPQELQDLFHDQNSSLSEVAAWFARSAKVGVSAANKFARTYLMLLRADLTRAKDTTSSAGKSKPSTPSKIKPKEKKEKVVKEVKVPELEDEDDGASGSKGVVSRTSSPSLHIDVQIHISPESSGDQIDKIFESMAKHLKGFKS